jgi:RNA polymerase sigma-70 factor (ECF subfamily)
LALTRGRADAEDLVHAVFVKLAAMGAPLLGIRQPASYLHRTLHTTWLDTRRRVMTGERVVGQIAVESSVMPNEAAGIDLNRALDALPAAQREVIVLHLIEGFSFREIGRQIGVSMFTAAARYRLAVKRLQKTLEPGSGDKR